MMERNLRPQDLEGLTPVAAVLATAGVVLQIPRFFKIVNGERLANDATATAIVADQVSNSADQNDPLLRHQVKVLGCEGSEDVPACVVGVSEAKSEKVDHLDVGASATSAGGIGLIAGALIFAGLAQLGRHIHRKRFS